MGEGGGEKAGRTVWDYIVGHGRRSPGRGPPRDRGFKLERGGEAPAKMGGPAQAH